MDDKNSAVKMSLTWKKTSYEMLSGSINDKERFFDAVMWCGRNSSVLRTVSEPYRREFSDWVFDITNTILEGDFHILDVPRFGKKRPKSWISKICHILNPWDYPLIYDTHVKTIMHLTDNNWQSAIEKKRWNRSGITREDAYYRETMIWAGLARSLK